MTNHGHVLRTTSGLVRGIAREGSHAFLGIPFAAPPVGHLRFRAPQRPESWAGVRDATGYGPTPQRQSLQPLTRIPEPSIPGDATLNVNVFTPSPGPDTALPVLVWIHGGGYVAGSPSSPWYDGRPFNRLGIVTVSLSYRLGFDGYGWLADAPLNRGMRDQMCALEWVQENIREFGGDPDRVTIAGQSAGADAVMRLLTSPPAVHLFRAAIAHSTPTMPPGGPTVRQRGETFARLAGVPPTVEGWSGRSEREIIQAQLRGIDPDARGESDGFLLVRRIFDGDGTLLGVGPEVDGEIVLGSVQEGIAEGRGADKPLLAGSTTEEFFPSPDVDDASTAAGETEFGRLRATGVPERLLEQARAIHPDDSAERIAGRLATDIIFREPLVQAVGQRAAAPSWMFQFAWSSPVLGASAHCLDLPFAWGNLGGEGVDVVTGRCAPQHLADEMHSAWASFIHTGVAPWPRFTAAAPNVRVLDEVSREVEWLRGVEETAPLLQDRADRTGRNGQSPRGVG